MAKQRFPFWTYKPLIEGKIGKAHWGVWAGALHLDTVYVAKAAAFDGRVKLRATDVTPHPTRQQAVKSAKFLATKVNNVVENIGEKTVKNAIKTEFKRVQQVHTKFLQPSHKRDGRKQGLSR